MTFLQRVCTCFDAYEIPYAVVGGYAVALHGAPRGTIDLDFVVSLRLDVFVKVERALKSLGLESRLPVTAHEVFNFRKEYIENRNLVAWSFYNPKDLSEVVDVIITENLDELSTVEMLLSNVPIKVLSKPDLIKMKKKSARKQDFIDVLALENL